MMVFVDLNIFVELNGATKKYKRSALYLLNNGRSNGIISSITKKKIFAFSRDHNNQMAFAYVRVLFAYLHFFFQKIELNVCNARILAKLLLFTGEFCMSYV